jgi:glycerol uptake facilitator protein
MMSIFLAEFFGTFILVLLGNGVTANAILPGTKGENGGWIVITAGWAFAVIFGIYLIGSISGAHMNPAITLAFLLANKIALTNVPYYLAGEFLGAFAGSFLVFLIYKNHFFSTSKDPKFKLMSFCTSPTHSTKWINFLTEVVGTFVLVISVFAILDPMNQLDSGLHGLLIGLVVFSIGLSLGGTTGYAINPARDLAPRLMHQLIQYPDKSDSEWSYAWIPLFGPLVGSVLGTFVYFRCIEALLGV